MAVKPKTERISRSKYFSHELYDKQTNMDGSYYRRGFVDSAFGVIGVIWWFEESVKAEQKFGCYLKFAHNGSMNSVFKYQSTPWTTRGLTTIARRFAKEVAENEL